MDSNIIELSKYRFEKSDYEDFYQPSSEEACETIEKVEKFLKDVEEFLKEKDVI